MVEHIELGFFSGQWKCGGTYPMKELGYGIFVPWLRMYYSLLAKKKPVPLVWRLAR